MVFITLTGVGVFNMNRRQRKKAYFKDYTKEQRFNHLNTIKQIRKEIQNNIFCRLYEIGHKVPATNIGLEVINKEVYRFLEDNAL